MGPTCSLIKLIPHSEYFEPALPKIEPEDVFKVSRFAHIRHDKEMVLSSPRAYSHLVISDAYALLLYYKLCQGVSLTALIGEFDENIKASEISTFLQLLLVGKIIEKIPPGSSSLTSEETDPVLRQWEFHDLLLQSQSRMGRSIIPIGGTYRFREKIAPPDAVKRLHNGKKSIALYAPPSLDDHYKNISLDQAITRRKSLRTQGSIPITARELGCFLFGAARIISRSTEPWPREYPFGGEYTKRPYPNGGARYELEIYITVNSCQGLERGFYYYDPLNHQLALISEPNEDMELLLTDSFNASGQICNTQILITVSSRFQRCSWKYQGLALSLQLKNLGVLYAHMYLIATAMDLAPCALGGGNSDRFNLLSGTDYYEESSIGEFLLGSKPE